MPRRSPGKPDESDLKPAQARQRVHQAMARLGLGFTDCIELIEYDPEVATACWIHDRRSGKEQILVGPTVAKLDIRSIEMVLRHEILHRSMYHGFGERFRQPELANLTLDICINRLLYEAYRGAMKELSEKIYPEESKDTLVALADCSASPSRLPDQQWRELWHRIWDISEEGRCSSISPSSLYYRLLRLDFKPMPPSPWQRNKDKRDELPKTGATQPPGSVMDKAVNKVWKDLDERLPAGSELGSELCEISTAPVSIGSSKIEDFIRNIRLRRIVDDTAKKLTEPLEGRTSLDPYPMFPSRIGLIYQLCGISDVFRLYWNRQVINQGTRLAIAIYLDVSGSMYDNLPLIRMFIQRLKEYPLKIKTFDTELHEIDFEQLSKGKIRAGGGTDFDPPLDDFTRDPELAGGLLFTDGEADVSRPVALALKKSKKPLFVVYVLPEGHRPLKSPLDAWASGTVNVIAE